MSSLIQFWLFLPCVVLNNVSCCYYSATANMVVHTRFFLPARHISASNKSASRSCRPHGTLWWLCYGCCTPWLCPSSTLLSRREWVTCCCKGPPASQEGMPGMQKVRLVHPLSSLTNMIFLIQKFSNFYWVIICRSVHFLAPKKMNQIYF